MGIFDLASDLADGRLPDVDVRKARAVVELVWEHREALVRLLTDLPGLLADAGEQMQVAGEGATQAGQLLGGELRDLTDAAADTLSATQRQVATVAVVMGELGKAIDRVPLVGNVAKPVSDGLKAIREVSDDLEAVAGQLRGIGAGLDKVGSGLDVMGTSLGTSGAALSAVAAPLPSKAEVAKKAAARKATPAKKPAAAKKAR